MLSDIVLGWDLGGAHLKAAAIDRSGKVLWVRQLPCPLWLGLEHLDRAVASVLEEQPGARRNAVTMTGELTDLFRNRAQGVTGILSRFGRHVPASRTLVYAGKSGFFTPQRAAKNSEAVASANWAASAQLVASRVPDALFVDIGSTTTDIVPIRDGKLAVRGHSDYERLACVELVYTGIVRTPVMALAERIPFEGNWIAPMAEYFATAADVYRVTGELPEGADQLPAADNGGKTMRDSARRLARMIGRDFESAPLSAWRQCARYLAELQLRKIGQACDRVLSRGEVAERAPLVGAGVGRFLVRKLATQLGRRYRDFDNLVDTAPDVASWASSCAPAVAVAVLAQTRLRKRK
jgi:(4-(4-[2-(gamma-L-glutamylamino)ethyl]phenoxymethyl)furan-2-yl)methanamine synthase